MRGSKESGRRKERFQGEREAKREVRKSVVGESRGSKERGSRGQRSRRMVEAKAAEVHKGEGGEETDHLPLALSPSFTVRRMGGKG